MEIKLNPSGNFELTLSSGRTIEFTPTEHGARALHRVLFQTQYNQSTEIPTPSVSPFLSQVLINQWEREDRARKIQEFTAQTSQIFGLNLSDLDITI